MIYELLAVRQLYFLQCSLLARQNFITARARKKKKKKKKKKEKENCSARKDQFESSLHCLEGSWVLIHTFRVSYISYCLKCLSVMEPAVDKLEALVIILEKALFSLPLIL